MSTDKKKITPEATKDSGLALVLAGLLLYQYFKIESLFLATLVFLLLTMTYPAVFRTWARLWFGFSDLLGRGVSTVVIGVAFFCIVTPIGMIRRAMGKDSLMLNRWKDGSDSVLIDRNHLFSKKDIERPY